MGWYNVLVVRFAKRCEPAGERKKSTGQMKTTTQKNKIFVLLINRSIISRMKNILKRNREIERPVGITCCDLVKINGKFSKQFFFHNIFCCKNPGKQKHVKIQVQCRHAGRKRKHPQ
jgi:hypothetical protein